jgi:hypothetical protein
MFRLISNCCSIPLFSFFLALLNLNTCDQNFDMEKRHQGRVTGIIWSSQGCHLGRGGTRRAQALLRVFRSVPGCQDGTEREQRDAGLMDLGPSRGMRKLVCARLSDQEGSGRELCCTRPTSWTSSLGL